MSVFVIAEAGVNHNGSVEQARKLVDIAANAGADAVKFQTFRADALAVASAPKATYQTETTDAAETQVDMLRALELSEEQHHDIVSHCGKRGIQFLSTPFDIQSARFLVRAFDVAHLKVPSGEITNGPLLLEIARLGRPVILSTGMSTLGEVEDALSVLAYGFTGDHASPTVEILQKAFASESGQNAIREKVTVLHCVTEYPAPLETVNLRAMDTLASTFSLPVGLSDHTMGTAIPIAAVARGATVIEKHFTLDRSMEGPDHRASLEPDELRAMIKGIRSVEQALGRSTKAPALPEWDNRTAARKSLVATMPIQKGETFTAQNIGAKRPGGGVSPMKYWSYIGRQASRRYSTDEQIKRQ